MDDNESDNEPESAQERCEADAEILNHINKFWKPFENNMLRVNGFLSAYYALTRLPREKELSALAGLASSVHIADEYDPSDILRSAVVFLHACLEEMLRTIALEFLPLSNQRILDDIPLGSQNGKDRPEKFKLGALKEFLGKTVEEVISISVEKHLEHSNYSDTNEITKLLMDIEIDNTIVEPYLSSISLLMKRRHNIVHRADVSNHRVSLAPQPINADQVFSWAKAILGFGNALQPAIFKKYRPEPDSTNSSVEK